MSYYKYLLKLVTLAIMAYLLANYIEIKYYTELVRNAIVFITISAGFYRSGLNIILKSSFIEQENTRPRGKNSLSISSISKYYQFATYLSIISVIFLILYSGLDSNKLPSWLAQLIIPIIIVNAYSSISIFNILMKCVKHNK